MDTAWFDESRFGAQNHDFSSVVHLEVVPIDSSVDDDTLDALGLQFARAPLAETNATEEAPLQAARQSDWTRLREEQDAAFQAALAADRRLDGQHQPAGASGAASTPASIPAPTAAPTPVLPLVPTPAVCPGMGNAPNCTATAACASAPCTTDTCAVADDSCTDGDSNPKTADQLRQARLRFFERNHQSA